MHAREQEEERKEIIIRAREKYAWGEKPDVIHWQTERVMLRTGCIKSTYRASR